jgi:hypothetical protein
MAKMISMCGLDCGACPAFIAHETNDEDLRTKTAAEWSKQFGVTLQPQDIDCVSCLQVEGPHISHCSICEIRKCGLSRKVENCAMCDDYGCETLTAFHDNVPDAKANLDEIRNTAE